MPSASVHFKLFARIQSLFFLVDPKFYDCSVCGELGLIALLWFRDYCSYKFACVFYIFFNQISSSTVETMKLFLSYNIIHEVPEMTIRYLRIRHITFDRLVGTDHDYCTSVPRFLAKQKKTSLQRVLEYGTF